MKRNLDVTALRSFVAVADTGGVTRAAGFLNLTQSAVSMQLKRLEDMLGVQLFDRSRRQIDLTASGEQLLSQARRIVDINDEIVMRMTDPVHEGEIALGVPHDIVYPAIPWILQRFNAEFPRMRVALVSSNTRALKEAHARGDIPLILTTEDDGDAGSETLISAQLIWVGAPEGRACRLRPLRLAFEASCIFRHNAQAALDAADISWEMAVEADSTRTVEAMVAADLAVHAVLEGTCPSELAPVPAAAGLPELPVKNINFYGASVDRSPAFTRLADLIRQGYAVRSRRDHDLSGRTAAAQ